MVTLRSADLETEACARTVTGYAFPGRGRPRGSKFTRLRRIDVASSYLTLLQ